MLGGFLNRNRVVSASARYSGKQIKGQIMPEGIFVDTPEDDGCNSIIDHVEGRAPPRPNSVCGHDRAWPSTAQYILHPFCRFSEWHSSSRRFLYNILIKSVKLFEHIF
jgi:hypothetical protein